MCRNSIVLVFLWFAITSVSAGPSLRIYLEPLRLDERASDDRIAIPARAAYDALRTHLASRSNIVLVGREEWDAARTRSENPLEIMKDMNLGLMLRFEYDFPRLDGAKNCMRIDVSGGNPPANLGSRPFRLEKKIPFGSPEELQTIADSVLAMRFKKTLTPGYSVVSGERQQQDIAVCDESVAWNQRESENRWQLYLMKQINGKPIAIGKPQPDPLRFGLGNRYLAVIEPDGVLAAYSIESLSRRVISDSRSEKSDIATNDERFVWIEPNPKAKNVFIVGADSKAPRPLDPSPRHQSQPYLKGDLLVWSDSREGSWDIYLHNFSTGETTAIATGPESQNLPALSGNYVVYETKGRGNYSLNLYNNRTKLTTAIVESSEPIGRPNIYGTTIVYQKLNPIDLRPRGKGRAKTFDIAMYDLMNKKELLLAGDSFDQRNPAIGSTHIFWEHSEFKMESRSPIDTFICYSPYPLPD